MLITDVYNNIAVRDTGTNKWLGGVHYSLFLVYTDDVTVVKLDYDVFREKSIMSMYKAERYDYDIVESYYMPYYDGTWLFKTMVS